MNRNIRTQTASRNPYDLILFRWLTIVRKTPTALGGWANVGRSIAKEREREFLPNRSRAMQGGGK